MSFHRRNRQFDYLYPKARVYTRTERIIYAVLSWLLALALLYWLAAIFAWQIRNPKANAATVLTYFLDVLKWHRLSTFQ